MTDASAWPATPRRAPRRGRWLGVALLAAIVAFVALGSWQVQRRAWKLALIERVEARLSAPPSAAPGPAQWPMLTRGDDEYRRVYVEGQWTGGAETLVQATTAYGTGFWVLIPLTTDQGWSVLVNRGFVDAARRSPANRPTDATEPGQRVRLEGLLRWTEPEGAFLRDNVPTEQRWFSRDVSAIANSRSLRDAAPYFIDEGGPFAPSAEILRAAEAGLGVPPPARWPVPGLTVVRFRNDHAVYALTWFGLALMSTAAFGWWWRRGRR